MNKGAGEAGTAETAVAGLEKVERRGRGRPPVETWQPELVREIDMRIASDGTWHYLGTPIARPAMVALFASILRREDDGRIALVTPVEKCLITVDDAPFVAISMTVSGAGADQVLRFETSVGDVVDADAAHPLRFVFAGDGHRPYVTVHEGLEALVVRAIAYDIMELCEESDVDGESWYGVWSGGHFWPVMRASEVGDAG